VPTYQYACTACGHQLEAVQSFADEPLTECPACEGRLRKLFSSVGVVFKGSGFYRTDSRSANGSDNGAGAGSAKESGKDSGTGSAGAAGAGGANGSSSRGSGDSGAAKDKAPATPAGSGSASGTPSGS
jgi:putative FmdB family regulatory protein